MPSSYAEVLHSARPHRAVGAFTCYDLYQAEGVIRAAEERRAPIILLVSSALAGSTGGERVVRALVATARGASVDALVQLDHATDAELVRTAADAGVDAVLVDGSHLSFEDNVRFTSRIGAWCRSRGVGVEAELGRVEGDEERAGARGRGGMTEPAEVQPFLAATNVDCLAVAVGNVHGHYAEPPRLDWDRLAEIAEAAPVPLALHGASGLPTPDLAKAISSGTVKINVNTELRNCYVEHMQRTLPSISESLDLLRLRDEVVDAVHELVTSKLAVLGWGRSSVPTSTSEATG